MRETYTHGHHESVLRTHEWRTAENSAGYLLALLEPGQAMLDVGCGPGTITADLAARVAPGPAVGFDRDPDVVGRARLQARERGVGNATFATGDVYAMGFCGATFDVAHAHQVLQHLGDPVAALREMRRVLRPGGLLAVRDSDYGAFAWWPPDSRLDRWREIYHLVTARNGAEADAGRRLLGWVQEAGFAEIRASSSTWTFADPASRAWWGGLWADRVLLSSFAEQAVSYGLADQKELAAIASGWRDWAGQAAGFFAVVHGEVLAYR